MSHSKEQKQIVPWLEIVLASVQSVTLAYLKDGSETGVCLVAHSPIHGLHSVGGWFTIR